MLLAGCDRPFCFLSSVEICLPRSLPLLPKPAPKLPPLPLPAIPRELVLCGRGIVAEYRLWRRNREIKTAGSLTHQITVQTQVQSINDFLLSPSLFSITILPPVSLYHLSLSLSLSLSPPSLSHSLSLSLSYA